MLHRGGHRAVDCVDCDRPPKVRVSEGLALGLGAARHVLWPLLASATQQTAATALASVWSTAIHCGWSMASGQLFQEVVWSGCIL